ncbi:MAG: peptide chain release factor N(5)-glutamine methyltransferase [Acidobacteriota bacterium]|nr:MAG: peptide chain release factor N(5)-glutamine methyltransferase [Acidobacteriota bacterium]
MATIAETLRAATDRLRAASAPNDVLDAQALLAHALGCDRTYLIVNYREELSAEAIRGFTELIERRATGEPLQYITGRQEFFGLDFEVTPDVLIPRPETEIIVEETIRLAEGIESPMIIDAGTGSGCLAVTLARELPGARIIATDISVAALRVARRNARRHNLEERISFLAADLLDALVEEPFADFLISNPPYVSGSQMQALQREVRDWEPATALTDFDDGLSFYRRLLRDAVSRLKPGGYLICEMGFSQSGAVTEMVDDRHWVERRLLDDLQGIPRTIVLRRA